jgi:hypothetical protein
MSRPTFNMLRACFWLLAAVVAAQVLVTALTGASCISLILSGQYQIGACTNIGTLLRDIWADALAAVLALLLAARGGNGPKPPPGGTDEAGGG